MGDQEQDNAILYTLLWMRSLLILAVVVKRVLFRSLSNQWSEVHWLCSTEFLLEGRSSANDLSPDTQLKASPPRAFNKLLRGFLQHENR
jgi:hypothetical protein